MSEKLFYYIPMVAIDLYYIHERYINWHLLINNFTDGITKSTGYTTPTGIHGLRMLWILYCPNLYTHCILFHRCVRSIDGLKLYFSVHNYFVWLGTNLLIFV